MVIDEFEYWENFPRDFSEPWFMSLCHEVIFLFKPVKHKEY